MGIISKMNLAKINLNLLVALDALLTERQVTHAAKKVFVTQSAMSIALAQLRELLQDEILVRGPNGMTPTKRALELQPQVQRWLEEVKTVIYASKEFDPASATRVFQIGMSDYSEFVVLPQLIQKLAKIAPGISLKISHLNTLDQYSSMEAEQLELAVGVICHGKPPPALEIECLFTDSAVCVAHKNHPLMKKPMTLKRFLAAKHISTNLYYGPVLTRIDKALQDLGVKRDVVVSLPHMMPALYLAKHSDYLLAVPKSVAQALAKQFDLSICKLPFPTYPVDIHMAWPKFWTTDPGHVWLRKTIQDLFKG